jgi:hypothetical protein
VCEAGRLSAEFEWKFRAPFFVLFILAVRCFIVCNSQKSFDSLQPDCLVGWLDFEKRKWIEKEKKPKNKITFARQIRATLKRPGRTHKEKRIVWT